MNVNERDLMLTQLDKMMQIPSPTGYTREIQSYLMEELSALGFSPVCLRKGGVICDLGGSGDALMLAAHVDTLGACVQTIKSNGALQVSPVGGLCASNVETETGWLITRFDGTFEGTFQLENASAHVNAEASSAVRGFDTNLEFLLDEKVYSAEDTKALGVSCGDIIALNPRFMITQKGFIKSRFLDDKASASVLLALARAVKNKTLCLNRKVYLNFTVYEEVGHGGAAGIPEDVTDLISVDMGCVGTGLSCRETQVSICAKDSVGPYHYELVTSLIAAAKREKVDYAVDVYPHYGSDADVSLKAGYDVRHALIGPGVYASHGYERTHIDGLTAAFDLLAAFLS